MKKQLWMVLVVAMLAVSAQATIRTVNLFGTAQFSTVQAAITAAVTGDTILVAPGTYFDSPSISTKSLTIIGAGWDMTTIDGGGSPCWTVSGVLSLGSVFEGMDNTSSGIPISHSTNGDSVTFRRCRMRSTGNVIVSAVNGKRLYLEDCLLTSAVNGSLINVPTATNATLFVKGCILGFTGGAQSSTTYFNGANGSPVEITNCTFVSVRRPFDLTGAQPVIAINNMFYDWTGTPTWGTFLAGSVFDYNASDATAPVIPGTFTNHILLAANDPFVTYDEALNYVHGTSDLHLNGGAGGLALTNTGHPLILDVDGSRSDVGAYGGPRPLVDNGIPAYPFVTSLTVPNLIESGDNLNVNSTGRVGPRY
jgi:hypothetical protein